MSSKLKHTSVKYVSWKDRTFNQITSTIQKNKNTNLSKTDYFKALPLKIYRREIANPGICINRYPRTNVSIDEINSPGGYIIRNTSAPGNIERIMINKTDNKSENGMCTKNDILCTPGDIARARVRNSRMNKPKYISHPSYADGTVTNVAFFQNSKQYLNNRMKSFEKNQNSLSSCVTTKPSNTSYKVQGAVSSSAHVLGRKLDTMDRTANIFYTTSGSNLAGALSYGVNENINNYKEKLGYPLPNTPVFRPDSNVLCKVELSTLRGKTG